MKNYFILDGKAESGPFSLDTLRSMGLSSGTLVRLQDNYHWKPVYHFEELASYIISAENSYKSDLQAKDKTHIKRAGFVTRSYELFIPVLIVITLGFITVSVDKLMESKTAPMTSGIVPVTKGSTSLQMTQKNDQPQELVKRIQDSISSLKKTPVKNYSALQPKTHVFHNAEEKSQYYRNNWFKYLTITNSPYKHRLLGGIKGLAIVFTNNTDYPIDQVTAEISYIKSNGKTWKTRLVPLSNIAPHTEKLQDIANVYRSKSVKIRIQKITSSSLQLSYDASQKTSVK